MKTLILSIAFIVTGLITAQDQIKIQHTDQDVSYWYPGNVTMRAYNSEGSTFDIPEDRNFELKGDYKLELTVPWSKDPEIYDAKSGTITVSNISNNYYNSFEKSKTIKGDRAKVPSLVSKDVYKSENLQNKYNLKVKFSNNLKFNYIDGKVEATQDKEKLEIKNFYVIQYDSGIFKISFNSENGETWWVFEPYK